MQNLNIIIPHLKQELKADEKPLIKNINKEGFLL